MSDLNINFELHNDISIPNEATIASHTNYTKQYLYERAKSVVDSDAGMNGKGFRASIFNTINQKIQELQIYLLNKNAAPYEYYSLTEPDQTWMEENGYLYWIQPSE